MFYIIFESLKMRNFIYVNGFFPTSLNGLNDGHTLFSLHITRIPLFVVIVMNGPSG
jgi:hypothetical protein